MSDFGYYLILATAIAAWLMAVGYMIALHRSEKIIGDLHAANRVMWQWVREANAQVIDWDWPE